MATTYNPKIATEGLVLCLDAANPRSYPGSGTVWTDLSGRANTGTLVNGPTFSSANGGSIVFDGINDYVSTNLGISNFYSISSFFRISSFSSADMRIFGAYSGASAQFTCGWNNQYFFRVWVSSTWEETTFLSQTNTYYHLGISHSSGTTNIYFNGNNIKSISGKASYFDNIGIGNNFAGSFGSYFNGHISQVSIYNRALTPDEITQNFNAIRGRYGI